MNDSYISIFEQKLRTIKRRIKKHIHDIPKDKVKKDVVGNLLKEANKIKRIILEYKKYNKK